MSALARWLDAARPIGLTHFRSTLAIESKDDGSPVTIADRAIESNLAQSIRTEFPEDGILGEEYGEHQGSSPWRWLLDPIDGTASFVRGMPLWGTLVGLEYRDAAGERSVVAGIADYPALDERLVAPSTRKAWWSSPAGRVPCRTSGCTDLRAASVSTTSTEYFRRAGRLRTWIRLGEACGELRGWSDCTALLLLATGRLDAVVEPVMHPWDVGPFAAILPAAGATWSAFDGRMHHSAGSVVTAATAELHRDLLITLAVIG